MEIEGTQHNEEIPKVNEKPRDEKGRLKTITDEQKNIFLKHISIGATVRDASVMAGFCKQTIYNISKYDEKFAAEYQKAKVMHKLHFVNIVNKAANKTWQAAAWILERKYHKEYSLRHQMMQQQQAIENVNASDIDYSKLSDDEVVLLKSILKKAANKE
jgi:hypothetical protein